MLGAQDAISIEEIEKLPKVSLAPEKKRSRNQDRGEQNWIWEGCWRGLSVLLPIRSPGGYWVRLQKGPRQRELVGVRVVEVPWGPKPYQRRWQFAELRRKERKGTTAVPLMVEGCHRVQIQLLIRKNNPKV